jgi:hypothetical protein
MKKLNIPKVLFLLSLTPYVAILIVLLVVAFTGYAYDETITRHNETVYGFNAMYVWIDVMYHGYFYFHNLNFRHFIFISLVVYQFVYLLKLRKIKIKTTNNETVKLNENNVTQKRLGKKSKIFLWVSLLPYAYIFVFAIISSFMGMGFFGNRSYGFDGFIAGLFIAPFTIIPILLICIIYQIIYLVLKRIEKMNNHCIEQKKGNSD